MGVRDEQVSGASGGRPDRRRCDRRGCRRSGLEDHGNAARVRRRAIRGAKLKNQTVGDELAKTAGELKRLDGALKTTEETLRQVKDQVSLVGTRTGIAQLSTLIEAANKALAEIKQATVPDQAKAALAPLADKLDAANKALAALQTKLGDNSGDKARDEALAQANAKLDDALKSLAAIGKTADALKGNGIDTAKLDEATTSLAAIKESLAAIKGRADDDSAKLGAASKSLAALDASVKQGFTDLGSKQADVMKAVTKPARRPCNRSSRNRIWWCLCIDGRQGRAGAGNYGGHGATRSCRHRLPYVSSGSGRLTTKADEADRRQSAHAH